MTDIAEHVEPEPTPPPRDYFTSLVEQDEDFISVAGAWAGTEIDRTELLNEIAGLALHFSIARLQRYQARTGTPRSIKVKIQVEVEGDVEKTPSGLILPN